jgi:membrane protease YdiL (CAAX protease family)
MKGFIPHNTHPFNYILLLLGFMLGGFFVGNFFAMVLLKLIYNFNLTDLAGVVQNPSAYPEGKSAVNLFQGISHFCAFTLAPLALLLSVGHSFRSYLSSKTAIPLSLFLLSALLMVVVMPANSWFIDLNANMNLPDFMSGFEQWAKAKEDSLRVLTEYLTKFESLPELLGGLVIFALVPAIGEELVFRGILQQQLVRWLRNPHVGIWVAAIIFGAIHMQFYGMLPRTLLGALLGYLYWWSGNIWVPIIGHFMNNGFTVVLMYLVQQKKISYDMEATEAMPLPAILFSILAAAALLYYLRQQFMAIPEKPDLNERNLDEKNVDGSYNI